MALQYDDIPGSWARHSQGWPAYHASDEAWAERAYVACTKEHIVPYGSYVLIGLDLRVETEELLAKLVAHMATANVDDTDAIIARVNAQERANARY